MFVENIELLNEVEKSVPSIFTVGFQVEKSLIEGWGDPIGESILYGFIKPCGGFAKGELNFSSFSVRVGERRDNSPVGVVKGGSEVMDGISTNECCPFYNGFVLFGINGALTGICICFDDIGKRALFAEKFVQLDDAFRGPINL